MRLWAKYWFLVLALLTRFLLGWHSCEAQSEFRFQNYDVEDGLSQNTVTCLFQDRAGYLWLGTQDGLNRYDGRNCVVYRSNPNHADALTDGYIRCITQDSQGRLWVGTRHGLNRMDNNGKLVQHYFLKEQNATGYHQDVRSVVVLDSTTMAMLSMGEVVVFNPNADSFKDATFAKGLEGIDIVPHANGVWVTSNNHLYNVSKTGTVDTLASFADTLLVNSLAVIDGKFWISHSQGLVQIDDRGNVFNLLENESCSKVFKTAQDKLWATTPSGIWDISNTPIKLHLYASPDMSELELEINDLLYDRDNNLWLASGRQGLWFRRSGVENFQVLSGNGITGIKLPDPVVWSFAQTDDFLFAGTSKGLVVLKSTPPSNYPHSFEENFTSDRVLLPNTHISALALDGETLWIGTTSAKGLYAYDLVSGTLENVSSANLTSNHIFDLQLTSKGLAIGCINGFNLLDTRSKLATSFKPTEKSTEANGNYIINVNEDSRGNLWLTSASGLYRLDKDDELTVLLNDPTDVNSLSYNITTSTWEQGEKLWVATLKNGIDSYHFESGQFEHFDVERGLQNGVVYAVVADELGHIWASHNAGISRLDTASGQFINFGIEDGLIGHEHGQNSYFKNDQFIYFGGVNGLVRFDPLKINTEGESRPILVDNLSINYAALLSPGRNLDGPLSEPKGVMLFPGDRSLTFELNMIDFARFDMDYQYMLEGFDPDWIIKPAHAPLVSYTSLPAGSYRFKSRHRMRDGSWSPVKLEFPIIVFPPIWQTWWFITSVSLVLILIFAIVIRYFAQKNLKEKLRQIEISQKIQKERERISMDLHDNVGAQITHVITSLDTLALKITMNKEPAPSDRIDELGDFARGTMQQLRDTIWAINKDTISLQEFINRINDFIQRTLMNDEHLKYHLHHAGDLNLQLNPTHTINLFRIVQEAITNVVKHASAELIYVQVKQADQTMTVKVIDDGIGIDPHKDTTGHYGLKNMEARMKEINGACLIESERGTGTSITLTINL